MSDMRPAEAWETNAAGPYCTLIGTPHEVSIWAVGSGRHMVLCDREEHLVEGHDAAHMLAHRLAEP
jgi:hypothetical protein